MMLLALVIDIRSKDVDHTELRVFDDINVRPVLVLGQDVACRASTYEVDVRDLVGFVIDELVRAVGARPQ